jgi:hypothetical protein
MGRMALVRYADAPDTASARWEAITGIAATEPQQG